MVNLLGVDIGNTAVSLAVIRGKRISGSRTLDGSLSSRKLEVALNSELLKLVRQYGSIHHAMICSVVPGQTGVVKRVLRRRLKVTPEIIGRDLIVPIRNNYTVKSQVGQDRLVGAYAVKVLYGFPSIIVDFGTAITFDVVNRQGEYDGGMIVPGIRLSVESLFNKTAMLPKVETIRTPRGLIGKNTEQSILSGIFHGYGSMCNGLIEKVSDQIGGKPNIIVTGGYTRLMQRFIEHKITQIDRNLVFKGLGLMHAKLSRP